MAVTQAERDEMIRELMAEGLDLAEARMEVAIGLGESDGDVRMVDEHGRPMKRPEPSNAVGPLPEELRDDRAV